MRRERGLQLQETPVLSPAAIPAAPLRWAPPVVSIVVPTFNEIGNVDELLARLGAALAGLSHEIVFVDDRSTDGTGTALKAIAAQDPRIRCIVRVGRRGLAGACIEGVLSSSAPYVLVMDADLQHDETLIPSMVEALTGGAADLVIASRYVRFGSGEALGARRGALSRTATRLAQHLLRAKVSDPMSGFFAMRRDAFDELAPHLSPVGFKILLDIVISARGRLKVVELPYTFRCRFAGSSKFGGKIAVDFAGLLTAKMSGGVIGPRFAAFCLVGAGGLAVHLIALKLLLFSWLFAFPAAQLIASFVAMSANFVANNALTYRDYRLTGLAFVGGYAKFCAICFVGALANVGTASWLYTGHAAWWGAGLAGALIGAVWNYSLSTDLVWGGSPAKTTGR